MSIDKKEFLRKGLMCTLVYEHSEWVTDSAWWEYLMCDLSQAPYRK